MMTIPAQLVGAIGLEHPKYFALSQRRQLAIASMLWRWTSVAHRHNEHIECIAIPKDTILRIWGNQKTMRDVIGPNYFVVFQGDNVSNACNAYWPMDYMGRALLKVLTNPEPSLLIDERGKPQHSKGNAILSRASQELGKKKHSVWSGVECAKLVPVNIDALVRLIESTDKIDQILSALRLIRLANNTQHQGKIACTYEQKSTGRIFEVFSGLQTTPREVRNAALSGFWDYDISNCHYAILSQWGKRLGHQTPTVDKYLKDKANLRAGLAKEYGLEASVIKECLIGLLYGASLSPKAEYSSISRIVGEETAKRFTKDEFIRGLHLDICRLRSPIVESLPKHRGMVGNALGVYTRLKSSGQKKTASTLLCHALQGVEALALRSVLREYGQDILLPMHDGWVSKKRLDTKLIEAQIYAETGFHLSVEEKQLPQNAENDEDKIHVGFYKKSQIPSLNQLLDIFKNSFCTANTSLPSRSSLFLSQRAGWNRPPCPARESTHVGVNHVQSA